MFISSDRTIIYFWKKSCTHESSDNNFNQGQIMQCTVADATGIYQYLSKIGSEI